MKIHEVTRCSKVLHDSLSRSNVVLMVQDNSPQNCPVKLPLALCNVMFALLFFNAYVGVNTKQGRTKRQQCRMFWCSWLTLILLLMLIEIIGGIDIQRMYVNASEV